MGKAGGTEPSNQYDTRGTPKKNYVGTSGSEERIKPASYQLSTEIERVMNLRKVLKEWIFDSKVELSLREVLGIAKKEFHDSIVDLVKRKRLSACGGTNDALGRHGYGR